MDIIIEHKASDGKWTLEYNPVLSQIEVRFEPKVKIEGYKNDSRIYTIPAMRDVRVYDEYVTFTTRDTDIEYQFKFEYDGAFIGDKFNQRGEHLGELVCYSFIDN